jgi:hypothetical protein
MMVGTDLLILPVMLMVWEINLFAATAFVLFFAFFDGVYLSANLEKVPRGGWYAIVIAGVVTSLSLIWHWGTSKRFHYINKNKVGGRETCQNAFVCQGLQNLDIHSSFWVSIHRYKDLRISSYASEILAPSYSLFFWGRAAVEAHSLVLF